MNFLNKLERKYGRYAIRNLPAVMIGLYVAGYILDLFMPNLISYLTLEPYYILHGQIWRIITWVLIPPSSLDVFTLIMLLFYFSIGRTLERTWGAFRFNFYILTGLIFTVIGSLIMYGVMRGIGYVPVTQSGATYVYMIKGLSGYVLGNWFSTYYINMSIFLAFALTYPDMQVLLYFIIPIKMKWMGILYAVLLAYSFIQYPWPGRVAIIASLLNFIIFFALNQRGGSIFRMSPKEIRRRAAFKSQVKKAAPRSQSSHAAGNPFGGHSTSNAAGPLHRCAICGRTEQDDPNLEFRYCSKCYGSYEYCQDHLFTHTHVQKPEN